MVVVWLFGGNVLKVILNRLLLLYIYEMILVSFDGDVCFKVVICLMFFVKFSNGLKKLEKLIG